MNTAPLRSFASPIRSGGGFTMIELMITLAIMAILITLAAPSFTRTIGDNRVSSATNEFMGMLQYSRSEAIRRSVGMALRSTNGDETFQGGWEVFTDEDLSGSKPSTVTDNDGTVTRLSGAVNRVTLERVTRSGTSGSYSYAVSTTDSDRMYLSFTPRGANGANASAFFRVCATGNSSVKGRIIQVSIVGKISLDSSTASCS